MLISFVRFNNYKDQMFNACGYQNPPQPNDSGPEVVSCPRLLTLTFSVH